MFYESFLAKMKVLCTWLIFSPESSPEEHCPQFELLRGRDGRDGREGEKGEKGEAHFSGEQGPVGQSGPAGPRGVIGNSGPRGPSGEKGERGDSGLQGPRGVQGPQGEKGNAGTAGGGTVYTRWGRTTCPTGHQAQLLYSGKTGASDRGHRGGAVNVLCMPDNPDHLTHISGTQGYSQITRVDYYFGSHTSLRSLNYRNVPCTVCYVPRSVVLMIPAKTRCPTNWTREYYGYLTAENKDNYRTMYECVDANPEGAPGTSTPRVEFGFVEPVCSGLSCPPYNAAKELTCVICTR